MRIDVEPRSRPSPLISILAPLLAICGAILIGGIVIALVGRPPLQAFRVYFVDPLLEGWSLQEIAVKATPLVLIAIGLSFCFRANLWNIGAEGQFILGGLAGGALAIASQTAGHALVGERLILPLVLIVGAVAGALYALIPALLRVWLGVSEILSSLMLVYVAELVIDYCVRGPLRDPKGFNFPQSISFDEIVHLPYLAEGDRLHLGVLFSLGAVLAGAFVFAKTLFGFEIRLIGDAPRAARFAGFDEGKLTLAVFAISGAFAGLAGIVEVTGQIGQLQPTISPGYGFTAIIVAFLGRLKPLGILLAGLVLALTAIGGENAQVALKLPNDMTRAFQGILLICVLAADALTRFRLRLRFGVTA